jgi:hypothetical protein
MTAERCGAKFALVGRMHRCIPRADAPAVSPSVTHAVTQSVTHAKAPKTRSKGAVPQAKYRAKDPEGYRQRHRDLMLRWRAAARSAAP